jgi:hypothetical protein
LRAPTAAPRGAHSPPPSSTSSRPTGSRSRATTSAPRGARLLPPPRTLSRPTARRSPEPTAASRGTRPLPLPSTCCAGARQPTYSPCARHSRARAQKPSLSPMTHRSHAPTAAPRDARPSPPPNTCESPTGSHPRAAPATLRAVRSSPLPGKGVLDATEGLAVAGAAPRLNIRDLRLHIHQAPQTQAPSPPPRHASHDSPLGAVRDRRGRRNTQF